MPSICFRICGKSMGGDREGVDATAATWIAHRTFCLLPSCPFSLFPILTCSCSAAACWIAGAPLPAAGGEGRTEGWAGVGREGGRAGGTEGGRVAGAPPAWLALMRRESSWAFAMTMAAASRGQGRETRRGGRETGGEGGREKLWHALHHSAPFHSKHREAQCPSPLLASHLEVLLTSTPPSIPPSIPPSFPPSPPAAAAGATASSLANRLFLRLPRFSWPSFPPNSPPFLFSSSSFPALASLLPSTAPARENHVHRRGSVITRRNKVFPCPQPLPPSLLPSLNTSHCR